MVPTFLWFIGSLFVIVLAVLIRRPMPIFLAACALILFLPFVDFPISIRATAEIPESVKLKVFSFNTQLWHSGQKQEFISFLQGQQADIYLLQEAFNNKLELIDGVAYLQDAFGGYHFAQAGDVVTVSKYPIVAQTASEKFDLWQGFLRTDLEVEGQIVSAYNIHLPVPIQPDKFESLSHFANRTKELFEARSEHFSLLETDLVNNPNPKLLAGDFNSTKFNSRLSFFSANFAEAHPAGYSTYPVTFEFLGMRAWRLDWFFTSSEWQATKYKQIVVPEFSDHDAMFVRLELQTNKD